MGNWVERDLTPHSSQSVLTVRSLIFGALTLVTIIPLVVFWFWPFSRAIDEDLGYVARAHLLIARNLGAALDRYHADVQTVFELLSANIEAGRSLIDVEPLLINMHFRHVCLAEPEGGRVLASFIHNGLSCPEVVPEGRLVTFREMAADGQTQFSSVMQGPTGDPLIYIVQQAGDLLTIGALQTTYFADLAEEISFGQQGHAAIFDQSGRVLAHPNQEWMQERRDLSALAIVQRMIGGDTGVATFHSPALQEEMIAGFTGAPLSGWGVMVPQPIAELDREIGSIRGSGLSVLVSGIAIALVVAWVVSGLLAQPIRQLSAFVRSVDSAQPSLRLPPPAWYAPMEMRTLSASLNGMLARMGHAAEQVIQAQLRAEHDNMAKTEFLANVSHELRTPLNAIVGFSDALTNGEFGEISEERQREYILHIHSGAQHLSGLIQGVMDVSSIEAGSVEQSEGEFLMDRAIDDAINLVRVQALAKGIRVTAVHNDGPTRLYGDARQFTQVLINLLTNAIKFTRSPDGSVSVVSELDPSGDVRIRVADNGIGIPADQISSIMHPFKRGEDSYVRGQPGSGLGLSIVSAILGRHGARLTLESTAGNGTTATIHWPRERLVGASATDRPTRKAGH